MAALRGARTQRCMGCTPPWQLIPAASCLSRTSRMPSTRSTGHWAPTIQQVRNYVLSLIPLSQHAYRAASALHVVSAAPGTVLWWRCWVHGETICSRWVPQCTLVESRGVPRVPSISYLNDFHAVGPGPGICKVLGRVQGAARAACDPSVSLLSSARAGSSQPASGHGGLPQASAGHRGGTP